VNLGFIGIAQFRAWHDRVDHSVCHKKLSRLKILGELLIRGLLDHPLAHRKVFVGAISESNRAS
jgi:hypothetical protein